MRISTVAHPGKSPLSNDDMGNGRIRKSRRDEEGKNDAWGEAELQPRSSPSHRSGFADGKMRAPIVNSRMANLPESARSLFDAAVPLPKGTQFLPRSTDRVADGIAGILVGGIYLLGGVLGSIVLTYYVTKPGSDLYKPREFWGTLLVFLVFLAILVNFARIGLGQFRSFLETWASDRERKEGRLRRGLFLTDEWLVLRMMSDRAFVVPRESVVTASVSDGGKNTVWVVVQYRQPNGKTATLSWERLELQNKSAERTCETIAAWRNAHAH